jgi:nitrate reductase delta subunit
VRRRGGGTPPTHPVAWQLQSLLLTYPDQAFLAALPAIRAAAAALPEPIGAPLTGFTDHCERTAPTELAADYVATFDHRRRCCLYLTYYAHGDTRKRGLALVRLKHTYAVAGLRLTDEELPDHLAVVLEFAATGDPAAGHRLLTEHRAGVELLRMALHDAGSPWSAVLDSVSATLPALGGDQHTAIARLAAEGPPDEKVGLDPFAPPGFLPDSTGARR